MTKLLSETTWFRSLPRFKLNLYAPPISRLSKIESFLGSSDVELWIRREDFLRPYLGHKSRYIEFLLGEYFARGHDSIIMSTSARSNYAFNLSLVTAELGISLHLVMENKVGVQHKETENETEIGQFGLNLLSSRIFGAEITIAKSGLQEEKKRIFNKAKAAGRNPLLVSYPKQNLWAYAAMSTSFDELLREVVWKKPLQNSDVIFLTSVWHSYIGMKIARDYARCGVRFHVVTPTPWNELSFQGIAQDFSKWRSLKESEYIQSMPYKMAADLEKASLKNLTNLPDSFSEYLSYGEVDDGVLEAVKKCAELEGLMLDPVYNGKTMAQLFRSVRACEFHPGTRIIFFHTGGFPNFFQQIQTFYV